MKLLRLLISLAALIAMTSCLKPSRDPGSVSPRSGASVPAQPGGNQTAELTYTSFVQPFFDQYCTACHSEVGGIPPVLETYDDAFDWAEINLDLMELPLDNPNYMPPAREIPAAELQQYRDWLEAGMPEN